MARYYRDPVSGKVYNDPAMTKERKSMYPPTEMQKIRIKELKDREEFTPHLDWLIESITKHKMLETRGGAGRLIAMMKQKIRDEGGEVE